MRARAATLLVLILLPGSLIAQSPTHLPVPLIADGEYLGEVEVAITESEEVLVSAAEVMALLEPLVIERVLIDADRLFVARREVPLDRLSELGLSVVFDWNDLSLRVGIPAILLRPVEVRLGPASRRVFGVNVEQAPVSAYLNMDLWGRVRYEAAAFEFKVTPELVTSIFATTIEAKGGVQSGEEVFFLDHARLVWDVEPLAYRLEAGDLRYNCTQLPNVGRLTGISFTKNHSMTPPAAASFVRDLYAAADGELTITLNDSRVHRREVSAGNVLITGMPFVDGINTIQIEWPGDDGSQTLELIVPHDAQLLAAREFDAGVAVGVANRDPLRPLVASYQSYGVTDYLTVGAREGMTILDANLDAGLDLLLATRVGSLGLAPSFGFDPGGSISLDLPLRYRYLNVRRSRYRSFGATGGYISTRTADQQSAQLYATGYVNVAGVDGFSVTPRFSFSHDLAAAGSAIQGRVVLRKSIRGGSSLSIDMGAAWDGELDLLATLAFSASLPERQQNFYLQQDLSAQKLTAYWSRYAGNQPQDMDFSISGQIPIELTEAMSLSGQVGYYNPFLRASLAHGFGGIVEQRDFRNSTSLRVRSAVAAIGGRVVVTEPISDAFVIVAPGESLGEVPFIVSQEGRGTEMALTDRALVLPRVSSHAVTQITAEPQALLLGGNDDSLRYVVKPGYRAGTLITLELPQNVYVGGVLKDDDEEPIPFQLGTYRSVDQRATPADPDAPGDPGAPDGIAAPIGEFFTDENGYFEIYNLSPGDYELTLSAFPGAVFRFSIPPDANEFLDLGQISAEEAP